MSEQKTRHQKLPQLFFQLRETELDLWNPQKIYRDFCLSGVDFDCLLTTGCLDRFGWVWPVTRPFEFPALHNGGMNWGETGWNVRVVGRPISVRTERKEVSRITFAVIVTCVPPRFANANSLIAMNHPKDTVMKWNENAWKCTLMAWDFVASNGSKVCIT